MNRSRVWRNDAAPRVAIASGATCAVHARSGSAHRDGVLTTLAHGIVVSGAQYVAPVGYADATTSSGASALGEQRAQSVADALGQLLQGSAVFVFFAVSSDATSADPADASSVVVSVS